MSGINAGVFVEFGLFPLLSFLLHFHHNISNAIFWSSFEKKQRAWISELLLFDITNKIWIPYLSLILSFIFDLYQKCSYVGQWILSRNFALCLDNFQLKCSHEKWNMQNFRLIFLTDDHNNFWYHSSEKICRQFFKNISLRISFQFSTT